MLPLAAASLRVGVAPAGLAASVVASGSVVPMAAAVVASGLPLARLLAGSVTCTVPAGAAAAGATVGAGAAPANGLPDWGGNRARTTRYDVTAERAIFAMAKSASFPALRGDDEAGDDILDCDYIKARGFVPKKSAPGPAIEHLC